MQRVYKIRRRGNAYVLYEQNTGQIFAREDNVEQPPNWMIQTKKDLQTNK